MNTLVFVKNSPLAKSPVKTSEHAAGLDICSIENIIIPSMERALIRTGLKIKVPAGTYGRLAPRSGLAWQHGIFINAGVIDRDFSAEIKVVMVNMSAKDFEIKTGMRICQLICEKIAYPQIKEIDYLPETTRSEEGFGSSGYF